ncbi:MAG: exo-alpha-sialidase [Actinomycetota bacterium]|nr:exo-alpha-sialidase [Actinomycetota bacterium]
MTLAPVVGQDHANVTELLIATKKGLFVYEGEPGSKFALSARAFAGDSVEYAMRDRRSGRLLASVTSAFYGPKIWFSDDASGEWTQAEGVALPPDGDAALARVWTIVAGEAEDLVYAGGDPGVLFESRDGGASWTLNEALWEHPTRPSWQPGGGGLCLHSIVPWPGDPDRLALAVSAAGVWLTDDGGSSWSRGNEGLVPRYLPEESQAQSTDLCVHSLQRAPQEPERIFMQFHGGVYRSDDAGRSWTDIAPGLPSDFAFPLAVDPADPDSAFVIPLTADTDRVTAEGRVRVYETRDAGASWKARGEGLPQQDAYLTVLRHAFAGAGQGPQLELYFGTTSGHVFGSGDAASTWFAAADCLPTVHSVVAVR